MLKLSKTLCHLMGYSPSGSSAQFSRSVMSDSLWPHGLQHTRLPCPSPTPGACSNSCSLSQWCHQTTLSCRALLLLPSIFSIIRVFSSESVLYIFNFFHHQGLFQWVSSLHEYSGLISFRIYWFDLLAVQGTLRNFSNTTVKSISSSASEFFMV